MIGLLDIDRNGLVAAGLERTGYSIRPLGSIDVAIDDIRGARLEGLIIETSVLARDSLDLLRSARAADLPTLVVARDRSVTAAVEALREGASDYLTAPFEYDTLLDALERLTEAGSVGISASRVHTGIITQDPETLESIELVRSLAASEATILIEGESGTGKELLARLVHEASPRRSGDLVSVNCAALPPGLLESELFGHERGAFTGAFSRVIGKFELAHGATILLDEIGELQIGLQAKLLRVIQEKQIQRVGAHRPIDVDFRLVVTTNRELAAEVRAGRFREDLFYRLNVVPVRTQPLRARPCDVRPLIRHFLKDRARHGRPAPVFADETLIALEAHPWPGNVRELENLVERLCLTHAGRNVGPADLVLETGIHAEPVIVDEGAPPFRSIREMERWLMVQTLTRLDGNRTQAARELGISLRTLRNKINEYQISEPGTLPRTGIAAAVGRQISPERR